MSTIHRKLAAVLLPIVLALAFVASTAIGIYGAGPATAVAATTDGRAEVTARLNEDYRELRVGQATLKVDRYAYREDRNYIAGIIKVTDFGAWDTAMRNSPEVLRQFLKGIADEVSPLATGGRYEIAWMVLDVVDSKPTNFESSELSSLPSEKWGVIRPLAHTACLYCKYGGGSVYLSTLSYTGPVTYRWKPGTIYFPALTDLSAWVPADPTESTTPKTDNKTEALAILNQGFRETRIGPLTLRVSGYTTENAPFRSILGMISVADYPNWDKAIREYPTELQAWLTTAAKRVKPLANGQFELAWSVVDLTATKPTGFTNAEMVQRTDKKYLVIRPIAYTWLLGDSGNVVMRPASSLPAASGPVSANWYPGSTVYLPQHGYYSKVTALPAVPKVGRPPFAPSVMPAAADKKAADSIMSGLATRKINGSTITIADVQYTGTSSAPSLLVFLSAAEYSNWEKALYADEAGLATWLFDMTEAARNAGGRNYKVTWAVVDVVETLPKGFARWEVVDVQYSRKLLVRTLAQTTEVSNGFGLIIRPTTDMPNANTQSMTLGDPDWVTTRRPMLFFNATGDALEMLP
ncbi:MAG: hypothetical protein K0R39_1529 [Symbiobacteriaceae bacterium]|nr:hypothetical protein [Symbiobacteriaceae bacterium]